LDEHSRRKLDNVGLNLDLMLAVETWVGSSTSNRMLNTCFGDAACRESCGSDDSEMHWHEL